MKLFKRGLAVAALAATSAAMFAGTSSAAITPNPYSTTSGTGSFTATTILGRSTCTLSAVAANLSSTTGGASGSVTGFTVSSCGGLLSGGRYVSPITVSINRGAVSANVAVLITNVLGGECSYSGTLTGTAANGGNSATVSGSLALAANLNGGYCSDPATASLSVTLPGASITW